jgi:hypothetical protein
VRARAAGRRDLRKPHDSSSWRSRLARTVVVLSTTERAGLVRTGKASGRAAKRASCCALCSCKT